MTAVLSVLTLPPSADQVVAAAVVTAAVVAVVTVAAVAAAAVVRIACYQALQSKAFVLDADQLTIVAT